MELKYFYQGMCPMREILFKLRLASLCLQTMNFGLNTSATKELKAKSRQLSNIEFDLLDCSGSLTFAFSVAMQIRPVSCGYSHLSWRSKSKCEVFTDSF